MGETVERGRQYDVGWPRIERDALAYDPEALSEARFVTAHAALRIRAELAARGHRFAP